MTNTHNLTRAAEVVDAPAPLFDGDLATHQKRNTSRNQCAMWLLIEETPEGGWKAVPDWAAFEAEREAERAADGADVFGGVVTRDSLLINADMATLWQQKPHRHPRERFVVELTPNGSRLRAA